MTRPLRKDAQRNRDLLVRAGREVFAEHGLEASLDDVARHAGVGVGTAYRHFPNKHELAIAIFEEKIGEFLTMTDEALADPDPWSGLVRFLEAAAVAQTVDRGLREVLMGIRDDERLDRAHDRIATAVRQLVERARRAGAVRADASETDLGMIIMMLCTVADIGGDASPTLWRRYLPMLLDGLRPGTPLAEPPISEVQMRAALASARMPRPGLRSAQ